ncbi:hypothetical protein B0H13DRAFT_2560350 [Mycena leptocephala]|nr:hypothetical protein B0H13DRAFT_2560350 [Mycena leptocephala]
MLKQRRKEKDPGKENMPADTSKEPDADDASEFLGVNPISLDAFRNTLGAAGDIKVFCACVDISALPISGTDDVKAAADALAEIVWKTIGYRFLSKKNPDATKQQDKGQMDMFQCGGWVDISPEESDCFVCIRHLDCHQKYVCIDVPEDIKKFIAENTKLRAPQLWKEILKIYPRPNFTQKAVYNYWSKQQQASWRRCDDEFESAKILLQEFANDEAHKLVSIPMPESDGFRALGFVFPSVLQKWDVKTNKAGFECFALLGEVDGSRVPLGFIFLKSNKPDLNEKEKYLRAAIRFITVVWHICTKQVLSDKDITEINALLSELPDDIKYQLCFWHCICAVKTRLSVLGRHPAHYNAVEAFKEFDWIDRNFVPIDQMDEELRTEENLKVAQTAIPTLKLRLTGQTSEVPAPARPKIVIHLNGRLERAPHSESSEDSAEALQSYVDSLDDDEEDPRRGSLCS